MKNKGHIEIDWELFDEIYNERFPTLQVLLNENGFSHQRLTEYIQAETNSGNQERRVD